MTLYEINTQTADYFHRCLFTEEGKTALDYLLKRGLTKETIEKFNLGYAPNSFFRLKSFLRKQGFSEKEGFEAGVLCYKNKDKEGKPLPEEKCNYYDRFRDRVMFPILDVKGRVIGFGGRAIGDYKPKYLNTSETEIFHKSNNLFAFNFVQLSGAKDIILCEGYMDVIAMQQAGLHGATASLGTAFTSEHAHIVSSYADTITLAYDADGAGQTAVERCLRLFEDCNCKVPIRVLEMPLDKAKDPDEFIKTYGVQEFKKLLKGITPFRFRMKRCQKTATNEERTECLKDSMSLISNHFF